MNALNRLLSKGPPLRGLGTRSRQLSAADTSRLVKDGLHPIIPDQRLTEQLTAMRIYGGQTDESLKELQGEICENKHWVTDAIFDAAVQESRLNTSILQKASHNPFEEQYCVTTTNSGHSKK